MVSRRGELGRDGHGTSDLGGGERDKGEGRRKEKI